jgi:endonuclease/exonuclease/phosphatase family metal-dependent hydrolase
MNNVLKKISVGTFQTVQPKQMQNYKKEFRVDLIALQELETAKLD